MSSVATQHPSEISRILLRTEFDRRTRANPRYSLRRFAQQLDIDPSLLSKVMQGKRKISPAIARKVIQNGDLNENEKEVFISRYLKEQIDPEAHPSRRESTKPPGRAISQTLFSVIADPIHYVILELLNIEKYRNHLDRMSEVLEISVAEIRTCLRRLRTVGLVEGSHNQWRRIDGRNLVADTQTSAPSLRMSHRRILEQSIRAMEAFPIEQRSHLWMTVPVNPAKIPLAKALLEEFRAKLTDVLETGATDSVYHLSFNLFPAHRMKP